MNIFKFESEGNEHFAEGSEFTKAYKYQDMIVNDTDISPAYKCDVKDCNEIIKEGGVRFYRVGRLNPERNEDLVVDLCEKHKQEVYDIIGCSDPIEAVNEEAMEVVEEEVV